MIHELEVHQIELEMQNEELRRAQEELEASRARYFDLYALAPVGYLTLSEQGLILEANLTATQLLGVKKKQLAGQPVSRFIFRDDQDIYYLFRKQLFERQIPLTIELRMAGEDGRPFWVQMKAKVAYDSGGALGWRATMSDISDRKRAEAGLQQLAAIVESTEDAIFTNSLEGIILSWNKSAEKIYGYSSEQIIGKHVSVLFPPGHIDEVSQLIKRISQGEHVDHYETARMKKDGGHIHVSLTMSSVKDVDARIVGASTIVRDITERNRLEAALIKSEKRYRSYIEVTDQLGWTTNPEGEVEEDIPSWRKFTGQSKEEVIGRGWSKALHPDDIEHAVRTWEDAVATKNNYEVEYRVRRYDGTYRHFLARGVPVSKDDGNILEWVGTCIDITERKRVESIVQARLRMLTASNKSSISVDKFLQVALDEIEALTGSTIGFYHFLEADQETLSLQNWSTNTLRNMCTAEGKGSHYPISQAGVWVDCVQERRPVIHNDFSSLPHCKGLPQGHATIIREMDVPIMRDGLIVAIIGMGNKPIDYDKTDVDIALLLGDFSWEIVERLRAEQALRERTGELVKLSDTLEFQVKERTTKLAEANKDVRRISAKLLSAQEEERKRIAGEIHDTIGSHLSAIKFKVEDAMLRIEKTPTAGAEFLQPLIPVIQEGIEECRRIQADLRPPMLDDLGLQLTLSWFFRRFQSIYSTITVEQEMGIEEEDVPLPLKIIVFRVIQEAMNNIAKYSKADLVRQSLRKVDSRMELVIRDNGQGFNIEEVNSPGRARKGLGLTSMKERVELSGGIFSIESAKGKGTVIKAHWPI
ncbi:MAG: PAS domain S-box protein [Deltaproteobacteria bacterium]|nr:PAS domain S-box protein [Deltaproteobacteria bacterium]